MAPSPTPVRPSWVSRDVYPFTDHWLEIDGHTVHYVDEGTGPTLLMLHGNPTWSFLYRDLITALSPAFRCVAPDLPGFGLSRAAPGYGSHPAEHARVVESFVRRLDLTGVTPLVQDWGGPIGLAAAAADPGRYRSLVVMNTRAWPALTRRERIDSRILSLPPVAAAIRWADLLAGRLVPALHVRRPLGELERQHYRAPQPTPESRRPQTTFLASITAARPFLARLERSLPALAHLPTLILWGRKDVGFPAPNRWRFEAAFPDHRTVLLPDAGHFVPDDAPDLVVEHLRRWWRDREDAS